MTTIKAASANHAYIQICEMLQNRIKSAPVKGRQQGDIYELRDIEIALEHPRKNIVSLPFRKLSRRYCAGEFALFMGQETRVEAYAYYAKKWKELDVDGTVCSAYGERIFREGKDTAVGSQYSRFSYALNQLLANPFTKNAVIMMRDGSDNRETHQKDRCCTLYLQFFIREGKLDMTVDMRSSDVWFGLPYDIFWYSAVMQRMLYKYNSQAASPIELGTYSHRCASLHLYESERLKVFTADLPFIKRDDGQVDLFYHAVYDKEKDYAFPEWDEYTEKELDSFLAFEKKIREENLPKPEAAVVLKKMKLHPFLETMGSFLINKITCRYPTKTDELMFEMATKEAAYSKCIDRKVGCVIRDEHGSCVSAHNNVLQCNQMCDDKENRLCEVDHAEVCTIRKAKAAGMIPSKAYVTLYPCNACLMALKAAGVTEIIAQGFSHKGAAGDVTLLDPAFSAV